MPVPFTTARSAMRPNANVVKPGKQGAFLEVVRQNATPWHRAVIHAEQADDVGAEHLDFGVAADEAVCRLTHLITPKQRHKRHARNGSRARRLPTSRLQSGGRTNQTHQSSNRIGKNTSSAEFASAVSSQPTPNHTSARRLPVRKYLMQPHQRKRHPE